MSDLKEFRYIGSHAESLDGGCAIESGGFTGPIDVSEEKSPHNAQLLAQGLLVEVPNGTHAEFNPVDDSEPETSNEAELTPPEDEADPDQTIVSTSPPVLGGGDDPDNEEGDGQ